jgi:hypothetical protein
MPGSALPPRTDPPLSARDRPAGGRHVHDSFSPQLSLAKLDQHDQAEAATIACKTLAGVATAWTQTIDLCDIGQRSGRWVVPRQFPAILHS